MWATVIVTFCAVIFTQAEEIEVCTQDISQLHIHTQVSQLPKKYSPLRWNDKHATKKTDSLVNYVKALSKNNPLKLTQLGPYDTSISDIDITANITFNNIVVTGIKELVLHDIEVRIAPLRIDFNVSIPKIEVGADFTVNAEYFFHVPEYIHGNFTLQIQDLNVSAGIGPTSAHGSSGRVYQLKSADVDVDLKYAQIQINMNKYAKVFEAILEEYKQNAEDIIVDNDVLEMVLNFINNELEKVAAKQIIKYLRGTSEPNQTQWEPVSKSKIRRRH